MFKQWLEDVWFDKLLPDHLKPVDQHIFSDAKGLQLIEDTEAVLDTLINNGKQTKMPHSYKKNGGTFQFRLKVNRKRMKLLSYDTTKSEAAIKKRIIILYQRKYHHGSRGHRIKEASVQYIKNGKTYVRSLQKSRYFQGIFYKLNVLDDVFLGQLIEPDKKAPPSLAKKKIQEEKISEQTSLPKEYSELLSECRHRLIYKWSLLPSPHQNRLRRLVEETEKLLVYAHKLDVEERYVCKRMLQKDIPVLLETYLSLSSENQEEQKEPLYEALTKMEINIRSMQESIEVSKAEEMKKLFRINEQRYSASEKTNGK
ncbi:hypothetical protein [Bacillus sp. FJAT-44742]|uniref:hypothetical protein n=1 Tax=Bacillus sp. FJAT-44742 TaxID=2014005 RepID=UPI000C246526|nr:hypothetical protein [Bacillus sp. FJAT-44742]